MLVNPYRDTWVVAKDFDFRGVKMELGSLFRTRSLHPRVWKRLIDEGLLVKRSEYEVKPEVVEEIVVEEAPVEKPKKKSKKKSTKKKES